MSTNVQLKGFIRFALFFKGEKRTITTGRITDGKPEQREVEKAKVLYGEWCGGSYHPIQKYKESAQEAIKMEVQFKNLKGEIKTLYWQENPTALEFQWLAFQGHSSDGKTSPMFIRGVKIISRDHGEKEFIVVEGI